MSDLKYEEKFPELVEDYAGNGLTDGQIAIKIGISRATFYVYKHQYPEFAEAVERGREEADSKIENSVYQLAMGNYYLETTVTYADGRTRITSRQMAPDLKAAIYWLERRDRKKAAAAAIQLQASQAPLETAKTQPAPQPVPPPPAPVFQPTPLEVAGAKALADYQKLYDYRKNSKFSKKDIDHFEDMMLVTLTEVERMKMETRLGKPVEDDGTPRLVTLKPDGTYNVRPNNLEPHVIKAWKKLAVDFMR